MDSAHLQYIFEHVCLPRKLPQSQPNFREGDRHLLRFVQEQADSFVSSASNEDFKTAWLPTIRMLRSAADVTSDGRSDPRKLANQLSGLGVKGKRPNVGLQK